MFADRMAIRVPARGDDHGGEARGRSRPARLPSVAVEERAGHLSEADTELVDVTTACVDHNTDGYLHTVAAGVRDTRGIIYTGLNVFHFTGGPCAELVALGTARAGGARDLDVIVPVGHHNRGVLAPCGRCRQVLADLHNSIRVIVPTASGLAVVAALDLLPFRYAWPWRSRSATEQPG
jgi:cytidine deaminase